MPDHGGTNRRELLRQATAAVVSAAAVSSRSAQAQDAPPSARLFPGFKSAQVKTTGATINTLMAGSGPPVLLLHGAPQSLASWHKVAPKLTSEFTVVVTDLRGYGDSSKPEDGKNHENYSKRAMALDQVEVMKHFGFDKFAVVGHDRGGRVAHRMALDHSDKVTKAAVLDIVPTYKLYHTVTKEFATAYYHWFFLIQPAPFPETLLGNSLEVYLRGGEPDTRAEYLRVFKNPATMHAMCEDYRAAASIDLEHDEADMDHKVTCPLLVLWAKPGGMDRLYDMLAVWRERATNISGKGMTGGHTLQEGNPDGTLAELQQFLRA
jgi:haloacetate dehalogenase